MTWSLSELASTWHWARNTELLLFLLLFLTYLMEDLSNLWTETIARWQRRGYILLGVFLRKTEGICFILPPTPEVNKLSCSFFILLSAPFRWMIQKTEMVVSELSSRYLALEWILCLLKENIADKSTKWLPYRKQCLTQRGSRETLSKGSL